MRPIKFRAWDKKHRIMFVGIELTKLLGYLFFQNSPNSEAYTTIKDNFDDVMWLQFTGLLDKNGKEIYEGDILKLLSHYPLDYQKRNPHKKHGRIAGPVTWEDGWLFAEPPVKGNEDALLYKGEAEQWEVIGNIYEKPELLTSN